MTPPALLLGPLLLAANAMNLQFHPMPDNKASAELARVQLVDGSPPTLLVEDQGQLTTMPQDARIAASSMKPPGRLPGSTWDARRAADGTLHFVFTQPGSAVSWLMSRSGSEEAGRRLHPETFAVYTQPRFVRGPPPEVTALASKNGETRVVLFERDDASGQTAQPVGRAEAGLVDARVVRDGTVTWLFTLVRSPVAARAGEPRATVTNRRVPAIMRATRLDERLHPVGEAVAPLGDLPIYEFDVDVATTHQFMLLATVPRGAVYAQGAMDGKPWPLEAQITQSFEHPLSSPSLRISEGVAHWAAIQDLKTPKARVLRGRVE